MYHMTHRGAKKTVQSKSKKTCQVVEDEVMYECVSMYISIYGFVYLDTLLHPERGDGCRGVQSRFCRTQQDSLVDWHPIPLLFSSVGAVHQLPALFFLQMQSSSILDHSI
ncbi:hypothetical protein MPTK1_1g05810 [Marchantia polymorpha subsp. ruderalis]